MNRDTDLENAKMRIWAAVVKLYGDTSVPRARTAERIRELKEAFVEECDARLATLE